MGEQMGITGSSRLRGWLVAAGGVVLLLLLLGTWLQVGIVEDPEFGDEYHVFWKAEPTFKVFFWSPVGMSDMRLEDMPEDRQREERDYRRYVLGEK